MTRRETRTAAHVRRSSPSRRAWARRSTAAVLGGVLALVGCDEEPDPAAEEPPPEETSPENGVLDARDDEAVGVSSDPCPDAVDEELGCIRLGALVDRTDERVSAISEQHLEAQRGFWTRVNEAGGVGGYEIHLADHVRDVTDDPQEQVTAVEELAEEVLAFALLPGDATSAEAADLLVAERLPAALPGWWSGWHAEGYRPTLLLPAEHSRCLAATAGLDWYAAAAEPPLTVLAVAHEPGGDDAEDDDEPTEAEAEDDEAAEAGQTARGRVRDDLAAGAQAWTEISEAQWLGVTTTGMLDDGDLQDAAVAAIVEQAPDVVVLGTGPRETGELVSKAAARGFEGTFLGTLDTWVPGLLDDPEQAQALQALYRHLGPWDAPSPDVAAHAAMGAVRDDEAPLEQAYLTGWVAAYPLLAALRAAVEGEELDREGLHAVLEEVEVDYEGVLPPRRLGALSAPARVVVSTPDAEVDGGLRTEGVVDDAPGLEALDHPHGCAPA